MRQEVQKLQEQLQQQQEAMAGLLEKIIVDPENWTADQATEADQERG
jgi:hypothetical protein